MRAISLGGISALLVTFLVACGGASSPSAAPSTSPVSPSTAAAPVASSAAGAPSVSAPASSAQAASASGPAAAASKPAATTAGPAGKVVVAVDPVAALANKNYDPANAGSGSLPNQFFWPVFDGLVEIQRDGKAHPALAKEWTSPDGKTWTFKLRDDIKFQDGTPFEAEDVIDTFTYYRRPATPPLLVGSVFTNVDTISAPDKSTVVIVLKSSVPDFPKAVALALVVAGRELQAQGPDKFFQNPVGTGPFKLVRFQPNQSIEFEAMPPEFVTPRGTANVKQLVMQVIPDIAAKSAAVRSGAADIAYPVANDIAAQLKTSGFDVKVDPGNGAVHALMDLENGPTKDLRVRQAVNYAVDRASILKNIFGGNGELDAQLIGKEVLGYNASLTPFPYDPAKATQLMADAGFAQGFSAPMSTIPSACCGKDLPVAISSDLGKINIKTTISQIEPAVYGADFVGPTSQRPGFFIEGAAWETYEADGVWRWWSSDRTPQTGRRWTDDTFNMLYQKANSTLDEQTRGRLYQDAGKYFNSQAPVLFLWRYGTSAAMSTKVDWTPGQLASTYVSDLRLK